MPGIACVLSRVAIGRRIAAADMATLETHAQVEPTAADAQTVLAAGDRLREFRDFDRVQM